MDKFFIAFASDNPSAAVDRKPDWGLRWPIEIVQEAFWIFYQSEFRVLPFAGGWLDQPKSLRDDLSHCLWGVSYHRQQMKKKAPNELPSFADKFGVKANGNGKHK